MIPVLFPEAQFNIKKEGEKSYIFCLIRKQWLLLTEEEWVRQNFINYLCTVLQYPQSLVAVEKELMLHGLKKRFDILIYNTLHQPWMLVECKAPLIALTEAVLQQALRYNICVPVDYIVITNGTRTMGWEKRAGNLSLIDTLPKHR